MRRLLFTVDVDRDVNFNIPGCPEAGSLDMGFGTVPRFSSSEAGLRILLDMVDDLGIKALFLLEGRTLESLADKEGLNDHFIGIHGYDHEDLTDPCNDVETVIERASEPFFDTFNHRPRFFRAPYMRIDATAYGALERHGIRFDSSQYVQMGKSVQPYDMGGIKEVPVPEGMDPKGRRMTSYLWPMHELQREPEDYVAFASQMDEGTFVIATHTWHMVETRARGPMAPSEVERNRRNVESILGHLLDQGFEPWYEG